MKQLLSFHSYCSFSLMVAAGVFGCSQLEQVVLQLNRDVIFFAFQVSSRHTDVSAVQQGLDQGEDLRAASSSGSAGVQVNGL